MKANKFNENILKEISKITYNIEINYPELYQYLDETPMTIPNTQNPEVDDKVLLDYLENLKRMLKEHIEKHK